MTGVEYQILKNQVALMSVIENLNIDIEHQKIKEAIRVTKNMIKVETQMKKN